MKQGTIAKTLLSFSTLSSLNITPKQEYVPLRSFDKIAPRIFLGNEDASKDASFFKKNRIKAVLNCSRDLDMPFKENPKIEYLRIPIDDSLKQADIKKAEELIPIAVAFIHKHVVIEKSCVLVHCYAGRQRSAIMLAAYLVSKGKSPIEACKLILKKRPEAFHFGTSLNFEKTLEAYARKQK